MSNIFNFIGSRKARRLAPVLDNGIYDLRGVKGVSFMDRYAVHQDGRCFYAFGYDDEEDTLSEIRELGEKGILPDRVVDMPPWSVDFTEIKKLQQGIALPDLKVTKAMGKAQEFDLLSGINSQDMAQGKARLLDVIAAAAKMRASDIRIKRHDSYTVARIKVAGVEYTYGQRWSANEGRQAINSAFFAQDDNSGETMPMNTKFQSFSISGKLDLPDNVLKLRCQHGYMESETGIGNFLVIRLFYRPDETLGRVSDLGLDQETLAAYAKVRMSLRGAVIIGGETGDGKSTTLVRMLDELCELKTEGIELITLEDPVEYRIERDCMTQVSVQGGGTPEERKNQYRSALLNFVRTNPNAGMVGEIRDGESAHELLHFANSGHGLYSTIHVDNALRIPFRMIGLGIEPEELGQPELLRLLTKQTLVPILCDGCKLSLGSKVKDQQFEWILEPLSAEARAGVYLRNKAGCAKCRRGEMDPIGQAAWAGYRRLIAVAEFVEPDDVFNACVVERNYQKARDHWLLPKSEGGLGGVPFRAKLTELVCLGELDPMDCIDRKGDLSEQLSDVQRASVTWTHNDAPAPASDAGHDAGHDGAAQEQAAAEIKAAAETGTEADPQANTEETAG